MEFRLIFSKLKTGFNKPFFFNDRESVGDIFLKLF